jgi:hypothetical protein
MISDADLTNDVQLQLDSSQIDTVIANNINNVFDVNNDATDDIFKKLYKKHKVLSINNPLIGSEFVVPPLTMSIVDPVIFRNDLK